MLPRCWSSPCLGWLSWVNTPANGSIGVRYCEFLVSDLLHLAWQPAHGAILARQLAELLVEVACKTPTTGGRDPVSTCR